MRRACREGRGLTAAAVVLAMLGVPAISAGPVGAQTPLASGVAVAPPVLPVEEGQLATFTVVATNPPRPDPVTLRFSTVVSPSFFAGPLLAQPDLDYTPVVGRAITLDPSNNYMATVQVQTHNDNGLEAAEPLVAQIHGISRNATGTATHAAAVINASDVFTVPPITVPRVPTVPVPRVPSVTVPRIPNLGSAAQYPTVSVDDVSASEGTGGAPEVTFTVRRGGSSAVPVNVGYRTVNGTAAAGSDYSAVQGAVLFDVGATVETVRVPLIGDAVIEGDETFSLELTYVYGATVLDRTGVATIIDDDQPPPPPVPSAPPRGSVAPDDAGYWLHDRTGQVLGFGSAQQVGGIANLLANSPARVVALAPNQSQSGLWLLDDRGGVYSLGSATFFGSMPGLLNAGVIQSLPQMAHIAAPGADGYALLSREGGVFTFGNARFFGSLHTLVAQGQLARAPQAVAMAYTPSGNGYWIVSADGGVFTFGDAVFHGSVPGLRASNLVAGAPRIIDVAPSAGGAGYALIDDTGGVFTFGNAPFFGSVPGLVAAKTIAHAVPARAAEYTADGDGYWIFGRTGGVYTFGAARFFGAAQFADDPPPPANAQARGGRRRR